MKILLTGATGYIGKRLLLLLAAEGHLITCCVRDKNRITIPGAISKNVRVIEVDFLDRPTLDAIPDDVEAAYYLIHSMAESSSQFEEMEARCAIHFKERINETNVKQVIYLSGIVNENALSDHLSSRLRVEKILAKGKYLLTTLRAGIIVGSGSASFEIIRDLVEKLPIMIAPKWLKTKCQPIGIRDMLTFLTRVLLNPDTFNKSFDIGGPDILSYREMLLQYADVRGLKRLIFTVPVMTPRLSSYWLYFVTSTSYKLAVALVDSMKVEVIARDDRLNRLLDVNPMSYKESIQVALERVEQNAIVSSWKDSLSSGRLQKLSDFIEVPTHGCFVDQRQQHVDDIEKTLDRIWALGGDTGWYYANWLWQVRGFIDKIVGGVGLRRGRTNQIEINRGDVLDFWRVLYADRNNKRLLLFAEMKVPGEAWLEFHIRNGTLHQTATFRPRGILGRLYWYIVYPLHEIVFGGMINRLTDT